MKITKMTTWFLGAVLVLFIMLPATRINAAQTLDQAFAVTAGSILLDQATISYTAVLPELPASDDGVFYLFEMQPYEYTIAPTATPIASVPVSLTPTFTVPYYETRLYTKLGLAVKSSGQNVLIANPQYITNPELLATHTRDRQVRPFVSRQGASFMNLQLSGTAHSSFNYATVQIMNRGDNQTITNPYARKALMPTDTHPVTPQYYMLNASESAGIAAIASELSRLAADSKIENFIIGNEVNVRMWNYMVWTDWDSYVREYTQVFRVAYNAVKSQNANARVFVCIDQNWDRNRPTRHEEYYEYIDGKDFLEKFNGLITGEGNIDWGVAQHPYPVPLTYAKFWDMSGCPEGDYMKAQVSSGKMLTFQNLSLLTDYLQSPEMLSPSGTVRHLILSEIGLVNTQGSEVQAAALCASYVAAKSNPYVEEIIYLLQNSGPQVDTSLSGQSQLMYDSFGTEAEATYEEWAKAFIGISDWSQVLRIPAAPTALATPVVPTTSVETTPSYTTPAEPIAGGSLKEIFDEYYYANNNADVKAAFGYDREALWNHFINCGLREGRVMNSRLDVVWYRNTYADLNAAFGDNWDAYVEHYLTCGEKEGRNSGITR